MCERRRLAGRIHLIRPVSTVHVCRDISTQLSCGYGFITFKHRCDAESALEAMNFSELLGKFMCISWVQDATIETLLRSSSSPQDNWDVAERRRYRDESLNNQNFLTSKLENDGHHRRQFSGALNALERMLVLDPDKRVSATEMLELLLFTEFREPEEETEALPYDHSMDNTEVTLD
ncbi:hypothetical protein G5714_002832 [Onychostoma macrolepis]|uniref:RRM domain-containing protein n=1 Tax=Onychostoma macrolepis TaxID=369639 RepID=A0A7J6D7T1_9TELE|nr:hypothetical protein G5714_002832 [Onychostoma macrolepis]